MPNVKIGTTTYNGIDIIGVPKSEGTDFSFYKYINDGEQPITLMNGTATVDGKSIIVENGNTFTYVPSTPAHDYYFNISNISNNIGNGSDGSNNVIALPKTFGFKAGDAIVLELSSDSSDVNADTTKASVNIFKANGTLADTLVNIGSPSRANGVFKVTATLSADFDASCIAAYVFNTTNVRTTYKVSLSVNGRRII